MIRAVLLTALLASPLAAQDACDEWAYLIGRLGCQGCAGTPPLTAILETARALRADRVCQTPAPLPYASLLDATTMPALRLPETMLTCDGWRGEVVPLFAAPQTNAPTIGTLSRGDDVRIDHDWIGAGASWDYVTVLRSDTRLAMGWTQVRFGPDTCTAYADAYVENGEAGD